MPTCHVAGDMYWNRDLDGPQMVGYVRATWLVVIGSK